MILGLLSTSHAGRYLDRKYLYPESISPMASAVLTRALAAAEAKDWKPAIDLFWEVEGLAPLHPDMIYNLSLVQAKAGNDLPALVWLNAFLYRAPESPLAQGVSVQVQGVEQNIEDNIDRLMDLAIEYSEKFHACPGFETLAQIRAWFGRFEEAEDLVERIPDFRCRQRPLLELARLKALVGKTDEALIHVEEAHRLAEEYYLRGSGTPYNKAGMFLNAGLGYGRLDMVEKAEKSFGKAYIIIEFEFIGEGLGISKNTMRSLIAKNWAWAGNPDKAKQLALTVSDPKSKKVTLSAIAESTMGKNLLKGFKPNPPSWAVKWPKTTRPHWRWWVDRAREVRWAEDMRGMMKKLENQVNPPKQFGEYYTKKWESSRVVRTISEVAGGMAWVLDLTKKTNAKLKPGKIPTASK